MRRIALIAVALVPALPGVAQEGWVTNRGGTTVNVFDPSTNTEKASITVGTAPIDLAPDQAESKAPSTYFVANSGSNSVSVVDVVGRNQVRVITGDSSFGAFLNPSGITRTWNGFIAVVDEQVVGAQKSTVRFISPTTQTIVDGFVDPTSTARYVDVVSTSNGRLWIADDGYNGIVVLHLGSYSGPPFPIGLNRTIQFSGAQDYADVIYDSVNPTPVYLINPQRLATNGTDRVVVADTGSDVVTILNATYTANATSTAIVANVDLGLASGKTCIDVAISGTKIYVTTNDAAAPVKVLSLTTGAILATITAGITTTVGGVGRTVDGTKVYVGGGAGVATIYEITTASDTVTATLTGFTGGSQPSGFSFTPAVVLEDNGTEPSGGCGAVGAEGMLFLGLLALLLRQRSRASQKASSSSAQ